MNKNIAKKLILSVFVTVAMAMVYSGEVSAECEENYGGGETCLVNKRFEIEKHVRVEDEDEDWEDKVMDVAKDDIVEFRIKVKNLSDDEAQKITDFDDMKIKDLLPDEMERVGGSGLTEYWDDFEPGETKTFIIEARVKSDEYDRDVNFEKCVVNVVKLYWDDEFEGSDTATVCYGDEEITELPETGANEVIALVGSGLVLVGLTIKKKIALV